MGTSSYDASYNMRAIMGIVDGTTGADQLARPGVRTHVVDTLSQPWQEILNQIRAWQTETWTGEKITTTCYRHHGTESTWLLVLNFNGLGTPMELRPGMMLRIPLKSEIDRFRLATRANTGVLGKTITI